MIAGLIGGLVGMVVGLVVASATITTLVYLIRRYPGHHDRNVAIAGLVGMALSLAVLLAIESIR